MRTTTLLLISCCFAGVLVAGCAPELKRAQVSSSDVAQERSEQMRLAREIRQQREQRLQRVAAKLMSQARQVCPELLTKRPTDCSYTVSLVEDDQINAAADGRKIYIQSGMMRFVESDDELAIVVGHEIAHNMLNHVQKKMGSQLLGALLDAAIASQGVNTGGAFQKAGALAYSQEYESEADYMGVYLAARAGFDATVAPLFWRRMAIEHPGNIASRFNSTHPSTAERSVALRNALVEIDRKNAKKVALLPERMTPIGDDPGFDTASLVADRPGQGTEPQSAYVDPQKRWRGPQKIAQPVGQWNYQAEHFAADQGCNGETRQKPVTRFTGKNGFIEHFEAQCANRSPMPIDCWQGGCTVSTAGGDAAQ